MPIGILFCEGGAQKPDIRLLRSVLRTEPFQVKHAGSKYGFGQLIRTYREAIPGVNIVGLRDRDFDSDDTVPAERPREWLVEAGRMQLGWYWERVELENYLIDPEVVQRALGNRAPRSDQYRSALRASAETIADYTAARTALSLCRRQLLPLRNAWGRERGRENHLFPDERSETDCRQQISEIVRQYVETQMVEECAALDRFEELLPVCRPGGRRFEHFLTFFAGKDLLSAMEAPLAEFDLGTPYEFRERILKGIETSGEDVWQWLLEWTRLRQLVISFQSSI